MTGYSASQPYKFVTDDARASESTAIQLWREGELALRHTDELSHARYHWFYLDNPEGLARVNLLLHDTDHKPVGFMGIGRRRMTIDDQDVAAGTLVDFVVLPKHRSAFPALLLQRRGREMALESMSVLYGLPDVKAQMICKRLGSNVSFDLPRYARVVRGQPYFERYMPRWLASPLGWFSDALDWLGMHAQLVFNRNSGHWVEGFDEQFDQMWLALDKRGLCLGVRDRQFLHWRFREQPGHEYRIFTVTRQDSLLMYFVCEISGETLSVKDCLTIGSEAEFKAGLLLLSVAARKMGIKAIELQASVTKQIERALRRAQFVLRSSRPFFAVIDEAMRIRAMAMHWYITPADEDV